MKYQSSIILLDSMEDFLRQLLIIDPCKRITAKEALGHEWFTFGIQNCATENVMARYCTYTTCSK